MKQDLMVPPKLLGLPLCLNGERHSIDGVAEIPPHESGARVFMTGRAHEKMFAYIDASPVEVSGFGRVEQEGRDFVITDVFMINQVNNPAHTVMKGKEIALFMRELHNRGIFDDVKWRCWWHSHVTMPTEFSGMDFGNMVGLQEFFQNYCISIVANKQRHLRCRMDVYGPTRYAIDHIPLLVKPSISKRVRDRANAEFVEKNK